MNDEGNIHRVPALVRHLYGIVEEFERLFPGRRFTPDGHLVGSIGEAIAASEFDIDLFDSQSEQGHDGKDAQGRLVQVKITQAKSVALRSEPEVLLVLQLHRNGSWSTVYHGPGGPPWQQAGKMQKNGQRPISLARLREIASIQ
jgi:hypothetical protein